MSSCTVPSFGMYDCLSGSFCTRTQTQLLHSSKLIWTAPGPHNEYLLIHVSYYTLCLNGTRQMISIYVGYPLKQYLVLWHCWLCGRKGIRPVKTEWWGAGVVICLERGADLHTAQLMPLPLTVSCFSKIQISFTFLVPAHPGSAGQRAVKRVCVCVCVCAVST